MQAEGISHMFNSSVDDGAPLVPLYFAFWFVDLFRWRLPSLALSFTSHITLISTALVVHLQRKRAFYF